MRMLLRAVLSVAVALTGVIALAGPGAAAPSGDARALQSEINGVLRQIPGGKQISANQVAWRQGTVVMTLSAPGQDSVTGWPDCGSGWYCFYQDSNWGYRRLQFSFYNELIDLAEWGFSNQASSWHDNSGLYVIVYDGNTVLWHMYPHSMSSWVGSANNDRADHFYGCTYQCW